VNNNAVEKFICNKCRHSWKASQAGQCPKCESYNIEIGLGRDPKNLDFKPGDWVFFRGFTRNVNGGLKIFQPYHGKLRAQPNAPRGSCKIVGEPLGLIFNPDGTLYCHAHIGYLLEKAKSITPEATGKEKKV